MMYIALRNFNLYISYISQKVKKIVKTKNLEYKISFNNVYHINIWKTSGSLGAYY